MARGMREVNWGARLPVQMGSGPQANLRGRRFEPGGVGGKGTVVLVHGFPDTSHTWGRLILLLTEVGYRVVVYDRRGCGDSALVDDPEKRGMQHHIADLLDVIADERKRNGADQRPLHVVGHDWGAQIAWLTAMLHPGAMTTVSGVGTPFVAPSKDPPKQKYAPRAGEHREIYLNYFMAKTRSAANEIADDPEAWLRGLYASSAARSLVLYRTFEPERHFSDGFVRDRAPEWMNDAEIGHLAKSFASRDQAQNALGLYERLDDDWHFITDQFEAQYPAWVAGRYDCDTPALYIKGVDDETTLISYEHELQLANRFSKFERSAAIPGTGHWVHRENPEAVASELLRFWSRYLGSNPAGAIEAGNLIATMKERFADPEALRTGTDAAKPRTADRVAHGGMHRRRLGSIDMKGRFVFSPVASEILDFGLYSAEEDPSYLAGFRRNARRHPITFDDVIARFSATSTKPLVEPHSDKLERTDTLGMAVRVRDPGHVGDLIAVNVPLFLSNDPAVFHELLPALKAREDAERAPEPHDRPDLLDRLVDAYRWNDADVRSGLTAFGRQLRRGWPASVVQTTYYGNHAYGFPTRKEVTGGTMRWARFRFEPASGDRSLPLGTPQPDYAKEIDEHLKRRTPITFTMVLELAGPDERLDDVSRMWPETLPRFIMGRLELDTLVTAESEDGDYPFSRLGFDPSTPPGGMVAPTGDAILAMRRLVYELSQQTRKAANVPLRADQRQEAK